MEKSIFELNDNIKLIKKTDNDKILDDYATLSYLDPITNRTIDIEMNSQIFEMIFSVGLLNAMSNSVQSTYLYDNIIDKKNDITFKTDFACISFLKTFNKKKLFSKDLIKKFKSCNYFIKQHKITIIPNQTITLKLIVQTNFGFINDLSENFKFIEDTKHSLEIDISFKDVMSIIKFVMDK